MPVPPTLYIGLGTSGMRMLEQTQRFFYSATGQCRPPHTRFLFVETDASKEAEKLLGAPAEGHAIEFYRTPIPAAGPSVRQLQTRATVRVIPESAYPQDAKVILTLREGAVISHPLRALGLPSVLFAHYAHVFSDEEDRIGRAVFGELTDWFLSQKNKLPDGSNMAVRLREDLGSRGRSDGSERPILEVFVPQELPRNLLLRIEVLFNGVELVRERDGDRDRVAWLPDPDALALASAGAGGMRSFGRIALWGQSINDGNCYLIGLRNQITRLTNELRRQGADIPLKIYICGTFAGGTNSGMFLDVAYLCRDILDPARALNADVRGLFLLPPIQNPHEVHASNAYACLRDLRHFSTQDSQFLARWPVGVAVPPFEQGRSPFELATLMSLSWVSGDTEKEKVSKLYRIAGLFLFSCGTGFETYRSAAVADPAAAGVARRVPWKFSALGMKALFYPRGEIRQCAAARFARQFLIDGLWLLEGKSQGLRATQHQPGEDTVAHEMAVEGLAPRIRSKLGDVLEETVKEMLADGPDQRHSREWLRDYLKAVKAKKRNWDRESLQAHLGTNGPFYQRMRNRLQATMERIYRPLGEMVRDEIESCENLWLATRIVKELVLAVEETLDWWYPLHLGNWGAALSQGSPEDGFPALLDLLVQPSGAALGLQDAVRAARFQETLRRMSIHFLEEQLTKFQVYLQTGNAEVFLPNEARPNPKWLPHLPGLDSLTQPTDGFLAKVKNSLKALETEVEKGVLPNDKILYHFQTGSFEGDVAGTVSTFKAQSLAPRPAQAVLTSHSAELLGYDAMRSLWDWLWNEATASTNVDEAASNGAWHIIEFLLTKLKGHGLPSPGTNGGIHQHPGLLALAQGTTTDLSVNMGGNVALLPNAPAFPKTVLTGNVAAANAAIAILRASQFNFFEANPQACDPEMLNDFVIFWDERPVRSLDDLANLDLWAPAYQAKKISDPSMDCYIRT